MIAAKLGEGSSDCLMAALKIIIDNGSVGCIEVDMESLSESTKLGLEKHLGLPTGGLPPPVVTRVSPQGYCVSSDSDSDSSDSDSDSSDSDSD